MSNIIITRDPTERKITGDYNQINSEDSDDIAKDKMEMWIAKNIGMAIMKEYPNREWGVRVNLEGKLCIISCNSLSTTKGYHLPFKADSLTTIQKRAVNAAGQILERYGISRKKKFDADTLETIDRDFRDEAVSGDSHANW